jgi:P-type E1-E2 ATPase
VTLSISIPGASGVELDHLLIDVNGTLTNRGVLMDGLASRIDELRQQLEVHLVSADTFGTLEQIAEAMRVHAVKASTGADKLRLLNALGPDRCAVIGNGANDALVLGAAAVGVAVLGPEGAATSALLAADVVCASAVDALDLLRDPKALSATLRP